MSKMNSFIDYACEILADTNNGISTTMVLEISNKFAVKYNVNIPHTRMYKSGNYFPNKRTALKENLYKFSEEQVFEIIKYITELPYFQNNLDFKKVKVLLYKNFPNYVKDNNEELDLNIIENKKLLDKFPNAKKVYEDAVSQFDLGLYERNIIDNLRVSLELLIKEILSNDKTLENNIKEISAYLKNKDCSQHFINMFIKLLDYYTKFNNDNIKHNYNLNKEEIEFVFELTNSFIKILIK